MLSFSRGEESILWIDIRSEATGYLSSAYYTLRDAAYIEASNENAFNALKPIFREICPTQNHH